MDNDRAPAPHVLYLNVEEVIDAAWSADRSLMPALSSKANSPLPEGGNHKEVYCRVYQDYVDHFITSVDRLSKVDLPGQKVIVEAGKLLRDRHTPPLSSFNDPLFEKARQMTPLPTAEDIEST